MNKINHYLLDLPCFLFLQIYQLFIHSHLYVLQAHQFLYLEIVSMYKVILNLVNTQHLAMSEYTSS